MEQVQQWPAHGPAFNRWNGSFKEFAELLHDAACESWWTQDSQLKYLNIRLDTRDCGFVIYDRDGTLISPDRVVAAIASAREQWGGAKLIQRGPA